MERRGGIRVVVDLPGEALPAGGGDAVPVRVRDLSEGGAQIQCTARGSECLAPGANCLNDSGRLLELELVCCPDQTSLNIRCRVVFVRRIARDEYRIGLRYADPLQADLLALKQFIRSHY